MANILDKLKQTNIFFDGAMGTMLYLKGLRGGEVPDIYSITHKDIVTEIHKEYIDSGCDVITTNTFGANSYKLENTGYTATEIVIAAINNAKKAIEQKGKKEGMFIACDIGSIGKLLAPMGDVEFEEAYEAYKEVVLAAKESGADLFIVETMTDLYDAKAAVLACKENSDLPVFCTMTLEKNDRTLSGSDINVIGVTLESLGVDAVGLNCSRGPEEMKEVVRMLSETVSIPIIIQPNAGLPVVEEGKTIFPLKPGEFACAVKELAYPGVVIFGGCCGTTPDHINEMIKKLGTNPNKPVSHNNKNVICSQTVVKLLDETTVISKDIILTPEKDPDDIIDEIYDEMDEGCQVVSLLIENNSGDFRDEAICGALNQIQSTIKLPFILKSSSEKILEKAARYYNGKPEVVKI